MMNFLSAMKYFGFLVKDRVPFSPHKDLRVPMRPMMVIQSQVCFLFLQLFIFIHAVTQQFDVRSSQEYQTVKKQMQFDVRWSVVFLGFGVPFVLCQRNREWRMQELHCMSRIQFIYMYSFSSGFTVVYYFDLADSKMNQKKKTDD